MPWQITRTVRLAGTVREDRLENVAGVIEFRQVSAQRWRVIYDVREVQFATIADALATAHPKAWCWRWRVGWRQFQDVNNRDNLLAKDGPCCNRPPRPR